EWVKELQRHVNINKVDKRKGEFSVNDLQELYDILTEEGSLPWDILGASLGLLNGTIKRIEGCCTTAEDCLKECLLQWLKWNDVVYDTGGPTCNNLKEALKCIGKEEIAKRVDEKFSPTKDTESGAQDDESTKRSIWKRFGTNVQKNIERNAEKISSGPATLERVRKNVQQNDIASVHAEIRFLSNTKRSSLVTINNKTPATIVYRKCYIARGREASYVGFDSNVQPKSTRSYSFEKHSNLSLEGCGAMLFFSASTCEPEVTKCFFVVAFRNYAIKLRRQNKTALMILYSSKSMDDLFDLLHYARI
uniref:Death domain-containing protein n=1 Tax=Amphimedon queenslandica TaxID=400682 RepID=A0A1X7SGI1_AMPQE